MHGGGDVGEDGGGKVRGPVVQDAAEEVEVGAFL